MEQERHLRLADLLAALSLETDLAMGHPPEEAMRVCLLATGVARRIGLDDEGMAAAYWTALLMHVGCTAFAHEQAALFGGDEIAVNDFGSRTDHERPRETFSMLLDIGRDMNPVERMRLFFAATVRGPRFGRDLANATCEVATATAERLGLPASVQEGLNQLFERWDGKGAPAGRSGDAIAMPARIAQVAAQTVVFDRLGGPEAAIETVRRRAGGNLDPGLCNVIERHGTELLNEIADVDPCRAVLDEEPLPHRQIRESEFDNIARAFADIVDLKSVFTLGHSNRVAELAETAGRELRLPEDDVVLLRRAGWLHDLGKVGVPNGIWEKPGPLTSAEFERVRLHPYHSERILSCSPACASLAKLAGAHHERLDGTGYYRQAVAADLSMPARVLAAADAYAGRTQERAHRPASSPSRAADDLAAEAKAGRLDAEAVDAVLAAAGHGTTQIVRQGWPRGLTDREVDVLRLVATGHSNREIGRRLYISPKTAGRHIENIYQKLGISSRPAAALFAVRHDLLRGDE